MFLAELTFAEDFPLDWSRNGLNPVPKAKAGASGLSLLPVEILFFFFFFFLNTSLFCYQTQLPFNEDLEIATDQ